MQVDPDAQVDSKEPLVTTATSTAPEEYSDSSLLAGVVHTIYVEVDYAVSILQYQLTAVPINARLSETTKLYPVIVITVPPASDPVLGEIPVINVP